MSLPEKRTNSTLSEMKESDESVKEPKFYFTTRRAAMNLPDYCKGVCSYCHLNVFVTDNRGKANGQYFHWYCCKIHSEQRVAAHLMRKLAQSKYRQILANKGE